LPGRLVLNARETKVLETVADFYDQFAERNEINSSLAFEAARASRKVAALYRIFTDRGGDARKAQARAVKTLEALIARQGAQPRYLFELARTYAIDGPGADEVAPEEAEPGLRRAIELVDPLNDRASDDERPKYAAALAEWNAQRAWRLEQLGRTDEASACHLESIRHDTWLAGRTAEPVVRQMLAKRRIGYAGMLIRAGREDDARPVLNQAADELRALVDEGQQFPLGGWILAGCAELYGEIGDHARANEIRELSTSALARGHQDWPPNRGGEGAGPHGDRPDGPGRRGEPR
jgi:hypothetical protein